MSRANPFDDLNDFDADPAAKPVPAATIEQIAQSSGFPSRKAGSGPAAPATGTGVTPIPGSSGPARIPRRHTTGRNRQINIKATEETITRLYQMADAMRLPLGAVLEQALAALAQQEAIE